MEIWTFKSPTRLLWEERLRNFENKSINTTSVYHLKLNTERFTSARSSPGKLPHSTKI